MNDGMTDKQYDGLLIEFLDDLETQLATAKSENATQTIQAIEKTINKTKRKLTTNTQNN